MNAQFRFLWALAAVVFLGAQALAADNVSDNAGKLTTKEMIFQSSRLGDLNVYNRADTSKKLGNLDNLIINGNTGHVLYGILDTGIGGKHVIVPWTALLLQKTVDEDQYWLTLNKTEDDLSKAPTFDPDHKPDFADTQWRQSVDNFFGVHMAAKPQGEKQPGETAASDIIVQSSKLSDAAVYNRGETSKKLGTVDNLVVNAHTSQVLFGVLDTGVGGKTIAVPWNAFELRKDNEGNLSLTLDKTQDDLAKAPSFDEDRIAEQATNPDWQQRIHDFFGVRMASRPGQAEQPER